MIFTDSNKDGLTAPVALHWTVQQSDYSLLEQLKAELTFETQKTTVLATELVRLHLRSQQLESYLSLIYSSHTPIVPNIQSRSSFPSATDSRGEYTVNHPVVGIYSPHTRASKIQHYKQKLLKYRTKVQVSRKFIGRSKAARQRRRMGGKFL